MFESPLGRGRGGLATVFEPTPGLEADPARAGISRNDNVKTALIKISGLDYNFEVADTERAKIRGLSDRDSMGRFAGMYFVFDQVGTNRMVMRDMRFPIDMIWLNGATVTDLAENIPLEPGRTESELSVYSNEIPGNGVLELPAGFIAEHGIKVGDRVEIGPSR